MTNGMRFGYLVAHLAAIAQPAVARKGAAPRRGRPADRAVEND